MEKSSTPNHNLLIRDEKNLRICPFGQTDALFEIKNPTLTLNSDNLSGIVSDGRLHLIDNTQLVLLKEFDLESVSQIYFSPQNKHLVVIQKPTVANNNLSIFSLSDYSLIAQYRSTTHPNNIWPQIRYSTDEKYMFKSLEGEIEVYETGKEDTLLGKIEDVVSFEVADIHVEEHDLNETIVLCGRVTHDKKKNKAKSLFSFYRITDLKKPIKSFPISHCDEIRISIASDNKNCLVLSSSAESKTTAYYGESTMYVCNLLFGTINKLLSHKEGPVLDFTWLDDGGRFLVCGGHQPAELSVYSVDTKKVKKLGNFNCNKIYLSPDRRLACIAGFGNIIGDHLFFNIEKLEQIGQAFHRFGGDLVWSPDSKFILSTVLSPRLRVDNEFKVFSYNGEEVHSETFDREVLELNWMRNPKASEEPFDILKNPNLKKALTEKKNKPNNLADFDFDSVDFNKLNPFVGKKNTPLGAEKKRKSKR